MSLGCIFLEKESSLTDHLFVKLMTINFTFRCLYNCISHLILNETSFCMVCVEAMSFSKLYADMPMLVAGES